MPEKRKKKNLKSTKHLEARAKKKATAKSEKKITNLKKIASAQVSVKKVKEGAAPDKLLAVYDLNGKAHEKVTLDPLFCEGEVNSGVIYQAVLMYQAGEREGTASTKDRGHVRGGGKKPWKQKGTGQARHGSRRSPLWRGGGTTFGPSLRDYSYSIPAQLKRKAVVEAIKDRFLSGKLTLMNRLEPEAPKTKIMASVLDVFKLEKPLFLVEQKTKNLLLASRNIPGVAVKTSGEVNALDVASHSECVMTKEAYSSLLKRLKS